MLTIRQTFSEITQIPCFYISMDCLTTPTCKRVCKRALDVHYVRYIKGECTSFEAQCGCLWCSGSVRDSGPSGLGIASRKAFTTRQIRTVKWAS